MNRVVPVGSTSYNVTVALRSSTTGQLVTGKVYGGVTYSWFRDGGATSSGATGTAITASMGTWASAGFVETDYAGLYQFGIPDACLVTGVTGCKVKLVVADCIDTLIDIQLVSATRGLAGTALPDAVPGAANSLLVAGSNAATTFATLTVTGATTLTGNVAFANGLTITQATLNGDGISVTGNGTGNGMKTTGGTTGAGLFCFGGASSGYGLCVVAQAGNSSGVYSVGNGSGSGVFTTSDGTGHGLYAYGGVTSGDGIYAKGQTAGDGMTLVATGASQYGLNADSVTVAGALTSGSTNFTTVIPVNVGQWRGSVPAVLADTDKVSVSMQHIATGLVPTESEIALQTRTTMQAAGTHLTLILEDTATTIPGTLSGLATPTNITAGTITTVTTLTNLPAVTENWLTAVGINTGAFTADAFAADAILAATIKADAVTKIQSGLATPTNITAAAGVALSATGADLVAATSTFALAMADAALQRDIDNTEVAIKASGNKDCLGAMILQLRHSNTVDNDGFLTVYETDGLTEFEQVAITSATTTDTITGVEA